MTSSEVSYGDWQSCELTVVGTLAYTHSDLVGAMHALADGSVDAGPLIRGTVGLDELPALLQELDSGKTQHAKMLVAPNGRTPRAVHIAAKLTPWIPSSSSARAPRA